MLHCLEALSSADKLNTRIYNFSFNSLNSNTNDKQAISFEWYNWKESWMYCLAQEYWDCSLLRKAIKKKFLSPYSEAVWPTGPAFCFAETCWDSCWWHDSVHLGKVQVVGRIATTFFVPWGRGGGGLLPFLCLWAKDLPFSIPTVLGAKYRQCKTYFYLNPIWWIWFCLC